MAAAARNDVLATVVVVNIPEHFDKEFLEDLFENEDSSGGGEIEDLILKDKKAIISFKEENVAKRVLRKRTLEVDGVKLILQKLKAIDPENRDVLIKGLPESVKEMKLKLFFEAKKRGGGPIDVIQMRHDSSSAVITYKNLADAKRVVEKETFEISGSKINVSSYVPTPEETLPQRSVYLTGLTEEMDEEFLEDLIESMELEAVPQPESIKLVEGNNAAVVVFDDIEAAETLISKGMYTYGGIEIHMSKFDSTTQTISSCQHSFGKSIKVTGLPKAMSKDKLQNYFESKKQNGGPVKKIELLDSENSAIVHFENRSDAAKFAALETINMKDSTVTIELHKSDVSLQSAERTVIVEGISDMDQEDLENLFENEKRSGGGSIQQLQIIGEKAVIQFQDATVIERLLVQESLEVDGNILKIKPYLNVHTEAKKKVFLTGLFQGTPTKLRNFLENPKRIDGGLVRCIEPGDDKGTFIVEFTNAKDADKIVKLGNFPFKTETVNASWYAESSLQQHTPTRGIVVEGLNRSIDEDVLEDLFENEDKTGGGSVESVTMSEDRKSAVIVFENDKVSKNVLAKGKIKYNGKELICRAQKKSEADTNLTILVTNIVQNTPRQMVELFLEKNSGGQIEDISYNVMEGRAVIKFKKKQAVAEVLRKHSDEPLILSERQLKIEEFDSEKLGKYAFSVNSCAIEIRDAPLNTTVESLKEDLTLLFENANMSGGTKTEEVFVAEDLSRAVITYFNPEVVDKVIAKHSSEAIVLEDQRLQIKVLPCPQCVPMLDDEMEDKLMLLTNLPEDITPTEVRMCMKKSVPTNVQDIVFGLTIGRALLTFEHHPVFDDIFEHLRMKPLKGNMISAERVAQTTSIEVFGIDKPKKLTEQKLKMYFEHKPTSCGGDVKNIIKDSKYFCAIVTFKHMDDFVNVLAKPNHKIDKNRLTVKRHYSCIGVLPIGHDKTMPVSTIPQEVVLDFPSHKKMVFIMQSTQVKNDIDKKLEKCYGRLMWTKINQKDQQVLLKCTLTKSVQGYQGISKSWERNIVKKMESIFETIHMELVTLPPAATDEVKTYVEESHESLTENVLLLPSTHYDTIHIVGIENAVADAKSQLLKKITEVEETLSRRSRMKTEMLPRIEGHQLKYLKVMAFKETIVDKFHDMKINIDMQNRNITFFGTSEDIKNAQLEMYQMLHQLKSKVEGLPVDIADMYQRNCIKKYIDDVLDAKGLKSTFFVVGHDGFTVYGDDDNLISTAMAVVLKSVSDQNVPLSEDSIAVLSSRPWKTFYDGLTEKHGEVLQILECTSGVRIICTDNILDDVYTKLVEFFKTNTIKEKTILTKMGIVRLLKNSNHLQKVSEKHSSHSVKVQAALDVPQKTGISIKGTEEGIQQTEMEIDSLIKSIKMDKHTVDKPGMSSYFLEETAGKQHMTSLENKFKVVIEVAKDQDGDDDFGFEILDSAGLGMPIKSAEFARVRLDMGMLILVVKDDVSNHRADCILVPSTKNLDPVRGIGKRLIGKAGDSIKQECHYHVSKGALNVSDVIATKAGKMFYHHIIHGVFPDQRGGKHMNPNTETQLHETFYKGFKAANMLELRNIVVPGSILKDYPLETSIQVLANAITDYCMKFHDQSLVEIKLVADDDANITSLQKVAAILDPQRFQHHSVTPAVNPRTHLPIPRKSDIIETPEGITLRLVKADIVKQKVDVIVNSTSRDLKLNNGVVSGLLLETGGSILQTECDQIVAKGFSPGMVADTTGGKLKCKRVYHGACEKWNNGDPNSIKIFVDFINGCLEKAHGSGMTSMCFPAIGTGILGYPADFVANTMIKAVQNFSNANPITTMKEIRFIVYHKDKPTVQAFEDQINTVNMTLTFATASNSKPTVVQNPDVRPKTSTPKRQGRSFGGNSYKKSNPRIQKMNTLPNAGSNAGEIKIGSITIKVRHGDLTKEKADAIVNSTSKDMHFISLVSKAILKAGGDTIKEECKALGAMNDHIAITGAGKLPCKHVIHIDAPSYDSTAWKIRILQCLKLAENNGLKSISFPALGTGALKISPSIMADIIMDATADFSSKEKPKHLNNIRIIIFDKSMMNEFSQELNRIADSEAGKKKGFLRKALDFLGLSSPPKEEPDETYTGEDDDVDTDDELAEAMDSPDIAQPVKDVTLLVYGFDGFSIQGAIKEIIEVCKFECKGRKIDKGKDIARIAKLTESQIQRIKALESKHLVNISINQKSKRSNIHIEGRPNNAASVFVLIKEVLSEADEAEAKKREEQLLYEKVKWQVFEEHKNDYDEYPPDMNYLIEQAYKAQKPFVQWTEKDGEYRIEFKQLQEYRVGDRENGIDVRRYAPGDVEIPDTWDPMDGKTDCDVKDLTPSDLEYEIVIQKFSESMAQSSYLNKVLSIKRIQNPRVYRNYMSNRAHVQMANPSVKNIERELWHGTDATALSEINATGFNRSFCGKNGVLWGDGVYFASSAILSHSYTKVAADNSRTMYLCRVLTGDFCKGAGGIKVPPVKDAATNRKYDSVVDKPENPTLFVVFYDALAYPEFLITYN